MRFNAKILLFGEYTALYNSDAFLIPFPKFSGTLRFMDNKKHIGGQIHSNYLIKGFFKYIRNKFVELNSGVNFNLEQFEQDIQNGLYFNSGIPIGYGIGSSGALVSAIFQRYTKTYPAQWKNRLPALKNYLSRLESYFHGNSSGLDPLVSFLNQAIYVQNMTIKPVNPVHPILYAFLIDTGISRSTGELIKAFRNKCNNPQYKQILRTSLIPVTNQCIQYLLKQDSQPFFTTLKKLSTLQFQYFNEMISPEYQAIWKQGLDSGYFYLKLCGAGGGGYLLGFTLDKQIAEDLRKEHNVEVFEI